MKKITAMIMIALMAIGLFLTDKRADAQSNNMSAWLDYACFNYPVEDGKSLVEFYYGILRHELTFAYVEAGSASQVDTGYQATAKITIQVEKPDGSIVDTLFKKIATFVEDPLETTNKHVKITDQISMPLEPGEYIARLLVEDVASQSEGENGLGKFGARSIKVTVPSFDVPSITMSGIELAYRIDLLPEETELDDYTPIDKSQRRVVPNPLRMFVDEDSVMYYYAEVYNLTFGEEVAKKYTIECKLLDPSGALVSNFGRREYVKPGIAALVSNAIDIHDMPEGSYQLYLKVTDTENGKFAVRSKPFQLLSFQAEGLPTQPSDAFTEADSKLLGKILHYALGKQEKDILEKLSLAGKREFFEDYFARRDPDPTTAVNEYKIDMFRRFQYANENFSVSIANKDDGWRSDQGRVWMKYGEPDEIRRFPYELDQKPFEIWEYHSLERQSGVHFVFVDDAQYGDYRLVHSNLKGERFDPEWAERLAEGIMH